MNVKGLGQRQVPRRGDFYNKDGALVCGSCGKEREWHGFWPGVGMTWAACACECDTKKYKKDREEEERLQKRMLIKMHREWAFPFESGLSKITFESDDQKNKKVTDAAKDYAKNFEKNIKEGRNLLFFGDVGTGKTFFAAAILNAAIDEGYKCLFTTFATEINEITKARDKSEYIRELKSYDFVVFDDFGTERETEYNLEQIYQIVNARYLAGKPMIVTTNMDNRELNTEETSKKRTISRILEKASVIAVWGDDRRTLKFKKVKR